MMIFIDILDILDSSSHRTKSMYQTNRILCILGQSWCVLLMWECQNVSVGAGETCCHFLSSSKLQAFVASATDAFSKLLSSGRPGCCVDSLLTSLNSFLLFLVLYYAIMRYSRYFYLFQHGNPYMSPKYIFGLANLGWQMPWGHDSVKAPQQLAECTGGTFSLRSWSELGCSRHLETCHGLCVEDVRLAHHPCDAAHDPRSCSCLDMCPEASQAGWGSRGQHCWPQIHALQAGGVLTQTIQRYPNTISLYYGMTRMLRACAAHSCSKINISQAQCPEQGGHRSKNFWSRTNMWPSMRKQQRIEQPGYMVHMIS